MLKCAVVAGIALWSGLAEAITWDFDDGMTQGWAAKEAGAGGSAEVNLFPGQVTDGVWTIDVSPSVAGEADPSPECPSDFFDHRLRFGSVRPNSGPISHGPSSSYGWFLLAGLDQ